jgi:hypothetical protein
MNPFSFSLYSLNNAEEQSEWRHAAAPVQVLRWAMRATVRFSRYVLSQIHQPQILLVTAFSSVTPQY